MNKKKFGGRRQFFFEACDRDCRDLFLKSPCIFSGEGSKIKSTMDDEWLFQFSKHVWAVIVACEQNEKGGCDENFPKLNISDKSIMWWCYWIVSLSMLSATDDNLHTGVADSIQLEHEMRELWLRDQQTTYREAQTHALKHSIHWHFFVD